MKCHRLRDQEVLDEPRLYWYRRTENDDYYFKNNHPPINRCQIRPRYIHTSNLAREITQTIRLCGVVFNHALCTQSCIYSLKWILSELKCMTNKF